jgi:hypothetical protein
MNEERKKPGWAFWTAIAISLMAVYVLSLGPAAWLFHHDWVTEESLAVAYAPFFYFFDDPDAPLYGTWLCDLFRWYAGLWSP